MISISLCMIVKDEEQSLERILEPMEDIADEIIIVDTGSSDSTKDIAAKYTSLVFDYKWNDDFAAARNFACEKATMDYWMWLDADDIITAENCRKLKLLKKDLDPDTDIVMMRYLVGFDEYGNADFSYYRERLIKNRRGFLWEGRVHETITPSGVIFYSDVEVEHRKMKFSDPDRNLNIYEKMIKEGEKMEPRSCFYYGRELFYHERYKEAVQIFEDFLKMPGGWKENKIDACLQSSYCYDRLNEPEKRLRSLLRSFEYDIPRAVICCEAGRFFLEKNDFETAAYWYEQALEVPDRSKAGGFEQKAYHDYIPLIQLCVCHDRMGNHYKAWQYHLRAAVVRPEAEAVIKNQKYFEGLFSRI